MKTMRVMLAGLVLALTAHATTSRAEDIDLYSGLGNSAGKPNVLIVFDNAANFSSNAAGSSCIIDGVATALSGTVGGIEQCAYYNVISSLPDDVVNVGMMVYNANNIRDINNANCAGSDGGCLVIPLTTINATTKPPLLSWIKSWVTTGGVGNGYIKSAGEATAATMQEAWAYYAGSTGLSGRDYSGVAPSAGCQQNFVIFIGNSFSSAGSPGDGGSVSPSAALANAPGVTTAQKALITSTYATTCGSYTFPGAAATHENGGFGADEWARYMYQSDLYNGFTGTQRITTYTIGLLGPSCQANYAATLTSMANVGGGKYFATTDYASITQALLKILNEVQAVNSVFSSSSLPVSVNAQGTYLNQIYMGMFRPDSGGNPRWVGNLKQYQFIYDPTTDSLSMGDSLGNSAISSAGTGFISANAVSFWTCGGNPNVRACSPADPTPGFWANDSSKANSAGKGYDLADGEQVDKGGAAQVLRLANLTNDYTTAAGTSTNPRKLYTYCPGGTSCNAALSDSNNAFAIANGNITASMFGAASTVNVSGIVRTGTSALVTTSSAHGFTGTPLVTVSGATQPEYNVTQNITVNSTTTFTITGLPDQPTSPSTGAYTAALHGSAPQSILSVSVSTSTTANAAGCGSGTIPNINCDQVTVSLPGHGYDLLPAPVSVNIQGVSPSQYSGTFVIGNVTANTFTYNVPVTPTSPAVNAYSATLPPPSGVTITTIARVTGKWIFTANNSFTAGQSVAIAGSGGIANGTYTVASPTASNFQLSTGPTPSACSSSCGTATLQYPVISIAAGNISRASATATTATATGITASAFSNGQTIYLAYVSGSSTNETAYAPLSGNRTVTITCSGTCTSFTFPIATTPSTTTLTTSSPTATLSGTPVTIPAGAITRASMGTTATVSGVANAFVSGQPIDISAAGAAIGNESAYLSPPAGWIINCPVACSTAFTFGPVTLTPASPATGAHITAYQGSTPPATVPLINWVRGADNIGDEPSLCPPGTAAGTGNCPNPPVTVRPSVHGDVLHSRPVVLNYGGNIGVMVFYGANDGVYRAVNGNQTNPAGSTLPPPGSELWGFIPTEFFGKLNRQQTNSPMLLMTSTPSGIVPTPLRKDYFADGSTGVYQVINADGTTNKAYIYVAMRRGGHMIYALDVSTPTNPQFLWKIDPTGLTTPTAFTGGSDYAELGQTWSAPKVAKVDGYANPVLIFGGGYDPAEDSEPPGTDTMGRGIFIVDAITGALVWSATQQPSGATACSGTATKATCLVSGMDYSIPADITLVDRDGDGHVDRLYAADVGGNVWRVDLRPTVTNNTPQYWQVNKLAALGCSTGVCAIGPPRTTPRKFFYPVDVVPGNSFDAVLGGQGDREHPLFTDASTSIRNRFFMLRDLKTGSDGSGATVITRAKLFDATTGTYSVTAPSTGDGTTPNLGYYITLVNSGEKAVNAPLTVAGFTYFGTNQPQSTTSTNTCNPNLGVARSYKVGAVSGVFESSTFAGGGLPPSPVAGVVSVNVTVGGVTTQKLIPFIIGAGNNPTAGTGGPAANPGCSDSSLQGCRPDISVSTRRTRTYWYQKID